MTRWLRWVTVVPSAIVAWFAALMIGLALRRVAFAFCPPELVFSRGECSAPWFMPVERAIMVFGAGLAAALFVLFPTIIAPAHRRIVLWVSFLVGVALAAVAGLYSGFYLELLAAIAVGSVATLLTFKHVTKRP